MAKVTRIKASDSPNKEEKDAEPAITRKKVVVKDKKSEKTKLKNKKKAEKAIDSGKKSNEKKPFILFRPFIALGRYLKEAWHELRQVRWPNAKATWKMVLAIFVYTAIFIIVIFLLDLFFTWLFNIILGKG